MLSYGTGAVPPPPPPLPLPHRQIVNATTAHYWWLETVASDGRGGLVRVAAAAAQTDEVWFRRA